MTPKLFSDMGLSAEVLKAIDKMGFEQAAPIQAEAIPLLMRGLDIAGQSQTGSGKTAAFGIPAVEKVDVAQRTVQVLVLCPTRELAVQVSEEIHKLAAFKRGLHALPIYGGQSYDRQLFGLRQGAHVVIGTPGRIMDHMRRGTLRLDTVKLAVLDEVDVMLNMGFRDDIELILQATPKERQTVFFSATIPRPIQQLIEKYSRNPQQVRMEQKALTVPTVEQVFYEVDRRYKLELLTRLIDIHDLKLGIIFCNTKRMVDDLAEHLNAQGYSADRLHGDMSQVMRDRVMNRFRKSGLEFLVATDVAARGLDVDDVEVVFNYDLPYDGEDYVHRIGRTGRRGRSGRAISFASGREVFQIRNIERYTNTRMQRGRIPSVTEVEEVRANAFLDKVRATLKSGEYKRYDHMVETLLEEGFASTDIASALIHQLQGESAAPSGPPPREVSSERPPRPGDRHDRYEQRPDRRRTDTGRPERRSAEHGERRPLRSEARVEKGQGAGAPKPPGAAPGVSRNISNQSAGRPAEKPVRHAPSSERPSTAPAARHSAGAPGAGVSTPKPSRRTPADQTRLWMNIGAEVGVAPIDIVNLVSGETGLPGKVVGTVDVRERHLFVDVTAEHANVIIAKLSRAQVKGRNIKVKKA